MNTTQNANRYSQLQHQHAELIRQLESQNYIFAQDPKVITQTLTLSDKPAYDRLFIRANNIDSTGELMMALEQLFLYTNSSKRLLYGANFILAMAGTIGLLGSQLVNFFYILLALLGWHTLSLLFWCFGLINKNRPSLLMAWFEKLLIATPIRKAFERHASVQNAIISVLKTQLEPKKFWYFSHILHTAWLFALCGSMLGLFGLFLFQRYEFAWSSTLLSKQHFDMMIGILGFIPAKLGLALPTFENGQPAQFAWLIMTCLALYGILPRLLVWAICRHHTRSNFTIDTSLPYYDQLLKQFTQTIVDQDNYQPVINPHTAIITPAEQRIFAVFEYDYFKPECVNLNFFGVIDDQASIEQLLTVANQQSAQIWLAISTHRPPDRGAMRKIKRLQAHHLGVVAMLSDGTHYNNWQSALDEQNIAIAPHA